MLPLQIPSIPTLHRYRAREARSKMDNKTKPQGSLGRLEDIAVQVCTIQDTLDPRTDEKLHLVFAGDHGVVQEGVSAYPAEVTAQMVANFCNHGAAINVLCRRSGVQMYVIDSGVNADLPSCKNMLIDKKIARSTANMVHEPAMPVEHAHRAVQSGIDTVNELCTAHNRPQVLGLGEMGIGNTTAAAAIVCATSGLTPAEAAGRGTGIDDTALHTKTTVIDRALHLHNPDPHDGIDIIHKVGGYEIAAMAGAAIGGAANGMIVVLDGLISTAAGCIASLLAPAYLDYCMVGHASAEPAHKAACLFLGKTPILDVQMRLGEGTGAVLAMDIIDAACCLQRDMASFDDAGVSQG